jgi:predicted Rossmann fold nucleotide-binding protein DprA/Smf involved in DNA uptake
MMTLPQPDRDRHLLTVSLAARLTKGDGPDPLTPTRFWELYESLDGNLEGVHESNEPPIAALAGRGALAALHLSELESQGLTVLTPFHPRFPAEYLERLTTSAPPILYAAGELDVLTSDDQRLAIVGSRDATDEDLDFAASAAREASRHGWRVVSGGARGVDAAGLNAAVEEGQIVIAVLTEGLNKALRKGALRRVVADGQAAVVSPVHPDTGFTVGNAMARNKLIYALADVTFVAAAVEGEGGTWGGASEALRRGFGRVAVNVRASAADALAQLGAQVVEEVGELFDLPDIDAAAESHAGYAAEQVSLFE